MINKEELIAFRAFNESDAAFIFSTWLKGLKFGNSWYRMIHDKIYYAVYHQLIEALLKKPTVYVTIACLKEDPSVILGYSVCEKDRIHWVHVKKAWRKIGLAKDLTPSNATSVSHLTEIGKLIVIKKKLIFNPFSIL